MDIDALKRNLREQQDILCSALFKYAGTMEFSETSVPLRSDYIERINALKYARVARMDSFDLKNLRFAGLLCDFGEFFLPVVVMVTGTDATSIEVGSSVAFGVCEILCKTCDLCCKHAPADCWKTQDGRGACCINCCSALKLKKESVSCVCCWEKESSRSFCWEGKEKKSTYYPSCCPS